MYGFQKRPHQAPPAAPPDDASARGFRAGGLVRGPGTGTSDSVKTSVPEGTYIMPADSTQEIGPEALGAAGFRPGSKPKAPNIPGMGFGPTAQVPVNLSNGEFRLSPEQVHAIGVQVLEGMKAATHTPAGEQVDNDGDDASTRELFFADGGLVEDPNKRGPFDYQAPGSTPPRPGPAPIPGAERSDLPVRAPAVAPSGQAKPAAPLESPVKGPLDSLGSAYGATVNKLSFGAFDSRGDEIRQQNRAGLIAQPDQPAAASPSPQAQSLTTNPGLAPAPAASATPPNSGPVPYTVTPVENTNGVQRINQPGKSPLFTNIDPGQAVAEMKGNPVGGFRPASMRGDAAGAAPSGLGLGFGPGSVGDQRMSGVGGPDVMGILQRENQIRAGMTSLRDEIAFNGGNGIGFRQRTPDEAVRELLFSNKAASRIAALNHMNGRQDAADQQENDQRQLAMKVQDSLNRQGIANEELGLKREAQGFQTRAARRQEELQARYEAAKTPEERNAIAQQIRDLSGREPPRADSEMVKARMNLIAELGKQYGASQPIADGKPVPFETWAEPMLRAAGLGQAAQPSGQQANPMPADKAQRKAGMVYVLADGRRVKWDGTGATEVN